MFRVVKTVWRDKVKTESVVRGGIRVWRDAENSARTEALESIVSQDFSYVFVHGGVELQACDGSCWISYMVREAI